MKKIIFSLLILSFINIKYSFSQDKKYKIHTIAFYNVENLFDTINDVNKNDEASPIMEIERGRSDIYNKKLKNLSRVISEIGYSETNSLPTIVGLSEVENKEVIKDLINTGSLKNGNYGISHFDSPDNRGIDVALIYRKDFFEVLNEKSHYLELYSFSSDERYYTRDQLVVDGLLEGERMFFIVNHWPSRSGGEMRSRPSRNKAAELNIRIIDSINAIYDNPKILTMGDFNDDPKNESIKKILNAKRDRDKVKKRDLYNPYEKMHGKGIGTLAYRDNWNLFDQIIFTGSYLDNTFKEFSFYKSLIYNKKYLFNQSGRFKGYPFRSFAGGSYLDGYSDHLPVYILLIKEL
tara:strand:- start:914 stop:1960 length:1047 start_codon:yes stop_codon:yes gene_type:complete